MKIVITERQHNLLIEQQSYNLTGPGSYYGTYGYDASGKTEFSKVNPHTLMTIAQIGTAFIPMIGPFVSAGIGLADAAMYYKEGDKKTAGIVAAFSVIPGIGGLASKLGLTKWTSKALGEIGKKISLGSKLTPAEIEVVEKVAQNEKLIKSEINAVRKNITSKQKIATSAVQDFVEGSMSSFKNQMKNKFPMTKQEAEEFAKEYYKSGKNFMDEYNKRGFGFMNGDLTWGATVLKNDIRPPIGKYLYHGTSTKSLGNISKRGLDNSLGQVTNRGSMADRLGSGVTTATGDIDAAKTFANSSAEIQKGTDVIIRFPNFNKHNMGFFSKHDAVGPKMLEYSYDGGKTWTKTIKP